jgi:hypothetical protein
LCALQRGAILPSEKALPFPTSEAARPHCGRAAVIF